MVSNSSEGGSGPPPTPPRGATATSYKERSTSLGGTTPIEVRHLQSSQVITSRQRSISGGTNRLHRQRSYKAREEDDKLKKSRAWANAYELSQDLHDKQLEMLERKYGGHFRAKRAARVIQQAFRQYCMNRNFEKLRSVAGEKRLSRRLGDLGRSNTIWTDMVVDSSYNVNITLKRSSTTTITHENRTEVRHSTLEDNINQNVMNGCYENLQRGLTKSQSLSSSVVDHARRRPFERSMGLDLPSVNEPRKQAKRHAPQVVTPSPEETNNNRNSCPELNDSSASDSPQGTPTEPAVDLPSVNFENLLESKETDILNDSFHSDGSQDTGTAVAASQDKTEDSYDNFQTESAVNNNGEHLDDDDTPKASELCSYDNLNQLSESTCSDSTSVTSDVQVRVDNDIENRSLDGAVVGSDNDRTPTQDDSSLIKVYANTEVRLRKKKALSIESDLVTVDESECTSPTRHSPEASPIWKRKSAMGMNAALFDDSKRMSNISEVSEPESLDGRESRDGISSSASSDTASMSSEGGAGHHGYHKQTAMPTESSPSTSTNHLSPKVSDRQRKRMYRIGLNLFNKKPEKGIKYLIERRFVDNRPNAVSKFLIARKGLSKQMIGEYLGNLQNPFNIECLDCFSNEICLSGLQLDVALRHFQSTFRMPGEAQKIERIVDAFSHRYCCSNPDMAKLFHSTDAVFLLSFAIIMLNTDLHNPNVKPERKMKLEDFIKNLRGIDDGDDIDREYLAGIYDRIQECEFKPGTDHVTQVMKVEQMIVGKRPQLALPHRRLVCYCRLYEVHDPNKREKSGLHQREVFLFNDMLMVTKIFSRKKNTTTYSFRQSFSLCGMNVYLFETQYYPHGVRLMTNIDSKPLITFNARNEHDRSKFVEDLKEAILEMNEMEALRIDEELQKQKMHHQAHHGFNRHSNDSGMVDIELLKPSDPGTNRLSAPECSTKKSALSNSLIDLSEGAAVRRGSGGSLDSGMASTSSGSTGSREEPLAAAAAAASANQQQQQKQSLKPQSSSSKFGGFFGRKNKTSSKSSLRNVTNDCSEV